LEVAIDTSALLLKIQHMHPSLMLALAAVSLAVPSVAAGQAVSSQQPDDVSLARRIEAYVGERGARNLSGTLLVARGDRVLVERSFGFASHELGVPFTVSTPTNVASITKPLTIIILSQLVEARKLALGDTVARWLPEYVHGSRMTVAQLMNHRAGVPHRLLADDAQEEPRTTDALVKAANELALLFEPGAQASYSSGGYSILAAVLERVTGKTYDELLQEYVARPVKATTIRHVSRRSMLRGRATSVIPIGDSVVNAPLRDLSFLVGAGSVYTTPRDVFTVVRGLLRGTYGPAARTALLRANGLRWNGITNGYRSFADYHLPDSLTVMFFANSHTGEVDLLRRDVPRLAAGESVPAAEIPVMTSVALSSAARERIEGAYDTGGGSIGRAIFISPSVLLFGDRAMLALNDSTFVSTSDYARVMFVSGPLGEIERLQWGPGTWSSGEQGPTFARSRSARP
jgi:CubicO group peptidase (beta-lactamase class C family)